MGFISADGSPSEYHGECATSAFTNMDNVKFNILGWDVERMRQSVGKSRR